jgi:SAM-dependent methyltransferase
VLALLAELVGPSGTAVGVEPNPEARAAARALLDAAGHPEVEVREGRGDATGLEEGAWDAVMCRHVLTHTGAGRPAIVGHLARLVRPGGHVYLVDVDLDGARTTPPDDAMTAQMERYVAFHRSLGNDVRTGPFLPVLLRDAGLDVVDTSGLLLAVPAEQMALGGPLRAAQDAMAAAGFLGNDEVKGWEAERQRFARVPHALLWMPVYVAIGRRPD